MTDIMPGQHLVIARDVTERIERERALEKYETIIEALNDPVYCIDEEGRFTCVNEQSIEMIGDDRGTIPGSTTSLIKYDGGVEQGEDQLRRLLSDDSPDATSFEVIIYPREGEPIVRKDHMGVLPYDGEFNGFVGTLRDIADPK